MVHAAEGTLQAYLDGEIDSTAEAALRDHVAACGVCAGELDALRRVNSRAGEAFALLDVPVPMVRARAALARQRRGGTGRVARIGAWGLARAALLTLVLAGAAAAAIPDVRRALETTISKVVSMFSGQEQQVAVPVVPVPAEETAAPEERSESFVTPAGGRVQIVLHAPTGEVEVVVRLVDAAQAEVQTVTTDGSVRLRVGSGRLEVMGLGTGTVTIGVPRDVPNAIVEVDGQVRVYKQGAELRGSGPDGDTRGSEVRFTTGS